MENLIDQFITQERQRVLNLYSKKHHPGFLNKEVFADWFIEQIRKQEFKCFYCDTSIFDIRKLIDEGKLLTRKTGYGVRGPILEVDRMNNPLGYTTENCVLSCYYCNNDKSYTLDSENYKEFFGAGRKAFFEYLLGS